MDKITDSGNENESIDKFSAFDDLEMDQKDVSTEVDPKGDSLESGTEGVNIDTVEDTNFKSSIQVPIVVDDNIQRVASPETDPVFERNGISPIFAEDSNKSETSTKNEVQFEKPQTVDHVTKIPVDTEALIETVAEEIPENMNQESAITETPPTLDSSDSTPAVDSVKETNETPRVEVVDKSSEVMTSDSEDTTVVTEEETTKSTEAAEPSSTTEINLPPITPHDFSSQEANADSDLMQQIELLRIVLQTVCCELAAANINTSNTTANTSSSTSSVENSNPLLLPLWMDVNSAQELQLHLKATINTLTANYTQNSQNGTNSTVLQPILVSEWCEIIPSYEENSSPFGLESPVITHMLSTWTGDENKILFLKSWIRSLQGSQSAGYPLGIQITNISSVVRDGFVVLLVPLIRQLSTHDPIRVLVRQHQIAPKNAKKVPKRRVDSGSDDGLFSRGDDSRVMDFSDSDGEEGEEEVDPFVDLNQGGLVYDIRIRRMAVTATSTSLSSIAEGSIVKDSVEGSDVVSSVPFQGGVQGSVQGGVQGSVFYHSPHHHHIASQNTAGQQQNASNKREISIDGAEHYSIDSHFPELYAQRRTHSASMSFRTDSRDYSSLSEISSALGDLEKVVAKEVEVVNPVPCHVEEPYNENKPVTAAAQINTLNSFFSSWFAPAAPAPSAAPSPSRASVIQQQVLAAHSAQFTTTTGETRSVSNERAAAEIIAASHATSHNTAVSEAAASGGAHTEVPALTPVVRHVNRAHQNHKMAARLEAMRKKGETK